MRGLSVPGVRETTVRDAGEAGQDGSNESAGKRAPKSRCMTPPTRGFCALYPGGAAVPLRRRGGKAPVGLIATGQEGT